MRRRRTFAPNPDNSLVDGALAALSADELRELILEMLRELDGRPLDRVVNSIIDRAARSGSGWTPDGPSASGIASILSFAEAAARVGYADPSEVDGYLRQGSNAFLRGNYGACSEIFRALLIPIVETEIDLGYHEMPDEVLGIDMAMCAAQYVVATYMTTAPVERALAVRSAIDDVGGIGLFWQPLREMERVAIEPLPQFDAFVSRWRSILAEASSGEPGRDWEIGEDRWLREVVQRTEGTAGLGKLACSTKRADDLRAWCNALVEAKDWKAALSAYEEAADIVTDREYWRAPFLDGAALAAQQLGRKDLPAKLERAWQESPTMGRLRRWLGSTNDEATIRKRARTALEACPKRANRQSAFLKVLLGDLKSAAGSLAAAPGLGWSDREHVGHLLFPLLHGLLEGTAFSELSAPVRANAIDIDEIEWIPTDPEETKLAAPEIDDLLRLAGIDSRPDAAAQSVIRKAMRKAAEKRVAGVTANKRRRHYGHAAQLVSACVTLDPTPDCTEWVAGIRAKYSRYPALQRELTVHLGRA